MPWEPIKTNDGEYSALVGYIHSLITSIGRLIPSIAFGTWTLGKGQDPIEQVEQGISVGFSHIGMLQESGI